MSIHRGVCPVFTERHQASDERQGKVWDGKPAQHIMLRAVMGKSQGITGTIEHPFEGNFARCTGCGYEERDYHFCDRPVSRYIGNWPHYGTCDARARNRVFEMNGLMDDVKPGDFWVCNAHTVAKVAEKRVEKDRKERERFDASIFKNHYGWVGKGYEDLLIELADYLTKNRDLVEADEWLKTVVRKMDRNTNLQAALLKAWGHSSSSTTASEAGTIDD